MGVLAGTVAGDFDGIIGSTFAKETRVDMEVTGNGNKTGIGEGCFSQTISEIMMMSALGEKRLGNDFVMFTIHIHIHIPHSITFFCFFLLQNPFGLSYKIHGSFIWI